MAETLPALPLDAWRETKRTVHLWAQIVGKTRLATMPKTNHWWHASLRVTPRGLGTGFVPTANGGFDVEMDFEGHGVEMRNGRGGRARVPLRDGLSVAAFHRAYFEALRGLGVEPRIRATPYDTGFSTTPFAKDEEHRTYDAAAVARFATMLRFAAGAYEEFAGRFTGKSSPVHFFWHSFDLAHTRFSGRRAPPLGADATPVEREAYSHEVASFGFWPGDEDTAAPGFYAYAAPVPKGLADEPLEPRTATWNAEEGMATLAYDDVRASPDPKATLLAFCESAYRAARTRADWAAVEPA
jgi:hypothetical protein